MGVQPHDSVTVWNVTCGTPTPEHLTLFPGVHCPSSLQVTLKGNAVSHMQYPPSKIHLRLSDFAEPVSMS